MATQKRASRTSAKKSKKSSASARGRAVPKSKTAKGKGQSLATTTSARVGRKVGEIKRALKKGMSELAKTGS